MRRRAQLHGDIVRHPIEIDGDGGLFALRQNGSEVDGERRGADAAFRAEKCVDLAQLDSLVPPTRRGARSKRVMASRNSTRLSGCRRNSFAPARMA